MSGVIRSLCYLQWDPEGRNVYIWQKEKKVTLEFSPEGETKFDQVFQVEEKRCAKAQRQ